MSIVDEQPMETLHLYVVPEDQVPQKPEYPSIVMAIVAFLCILAIIGMSLFSGAPAAQEVSFTLTIPGFHLVPVSKTMKTTVVATGKGHTPATTATGIITFYNGLPYTQIVPIGTRLTGADGIRIVTDADAVIPPVAKTTPPTDGHISVLAHALVPGASGNIQAGAINEACCVTSVIAQNPSNFTGGKNARDYTYLTNQDIQHATTSLVPTLQTQTLSLLSTPQLNASCSTTSTSSPTVGKETQSAVLTIVATCTASSYSIKSVTHAIITYSKKFGNGTLTKTQVVIVSVTGRRGVAIRLYVVGQWQPFIIRQYWTGK